jgi:hypothetical protein
VMDLTPRNNKQHALAARRDPFQSASHNAATPHRGYSPPSLSADQTRSDQAAQM